MMMWLCWFLMNCASVFVSWVWLKFEILFLGLLNLTCLMIFFSSMFFFCFK
ncbi:hypothetical protein OIU78_006520 [Salix suchowensis]|nr:hypothetical protein OIU78_006520 [Salix suchowensis]